MKHSVGSVLIPVVLKLKSMGRSRPLGSRVFGWRSSSKKACAQASSGERREAGVYSSSREQRAMASGGVRGLKTCVQEKAAAFQNNREQS